MKIIMQFPMDVTTYRDYLHTVRFVDSVDRSMARMNRSSKISAQFSKQSH